MPLGDQDYSNHVPSRGDFGCWNSSGPVVTYSMTNDELSAAIKYACDAANLATAYSVREAMLDHLKQLNAIQITRASALTV